MLNDPNDPRNGIDFDPRDTNRNGLVDPAEALPRDTIVEKPVVTKSKNKNLGYIIGGCIALFVVCALIVGGVYLLFGDGPANATIQGATATPSPTAMVVSPSKAPATALPTQVGQATNAASTMVPTNAAALAAVNTVVPTDTAIAPDNTVLPLSDTLYESKKFCGALPSAALKHAARASNVAGLTYKTPNGIDVGSDLGWNQVTWVDSYENWTKFLSYSTAWEIPPGETVSFKMKFETVRLQREGSEDIAFSSWLCAITDPNNGNYFAEGLSLNAVNPLTIVIDYGNGPQQASSVQLVPDKEMYVAMTCPKENATSCTFSIGQYGLLHDINTGEVGDQSIQNIGGNLAIPGALDSTFAGPWQWLQSLK